MKEKFLYAVLFSGLLTVAAHADPTFYTSPADYDAATNSNTPYDFGVVGSSGPGLLASPFTVGPLSFSSAVLRRYTDDDYETGNNYIAADGGGGTPSITAGLKPNSPAAVTGVTIMDISLTGATALAFDLGTYNGADTISIEINGTYDTSITTSDGNPTSVFFGVTSPVPITSLEFGIGGSEFDVLDFDVAAVPEPSTVAMLGLVAVGCFAWAARRRSGRARQI